MVRGNILYQVNDTIAKPNQKELLIPGRNPSAKVTKFDSLKGCIKNWSMKVFLFCVFVSCRNRTTDSDISGSDRHNFHFGSILRITGLQYRDFIHISFHNKVNSLDRHSAKTLVINSGKAMGEVSSLPLAFLRCENQSQMKTGPETFGSGFGFVCFSNLKEQPQNH